MKILYQKHHGLPGIPQSKGLDGRTGAEGNNVYFGYVGDFFNNVEIEIDNFVRMALRKNGSIHVNPSSTTKYGSTNVNTNTYYTGIYDSSVLMTPKADVTNMSNDTPDSSNFFDYIYNHPEGLPYYDYSYDSTHTDSSTYIKVDTGNTNISGFNTDTPNENLWWGEYDSPTKSTDNWPYTKFDGTKSSGDAVDLMTKSSAVSKIGSFEVFSIDSGSSKKYVYKSDNEHYDDFRYSSYNSNNKTYSSGVPTGVLGSNGSELKSTYLEYLMYQYKNIDYMPDGYSNSVNYVKYAQKAIEKVYITSTLNDSIKAGDVIYFYTNPNEFALDLTVEHMVVITKSLENCTLDDLISASSITEPLTFKYINTSSIKGNEYLSTNNKACAVYYPNNVNTELHGKNMCNMLTYCSDSVLNIGNVSETSNKIVNSLILKSDDNEFDIYSQVSDNKVQNVITSTADNSLIKVSNVLAKKYNIGNIETEKCLMPTLFKLDSFGKCYTISEKDYDYIRNVITILKSDILNNEQIDNFSCGVIDISYDKSITDKDLLIENENCLVKKYIFKNHNDMSFLLEKTYGNETEHILLLWISDNNGNKHYSNKTIAEYDYSIKNYVFYVSDDNPEITQEQSENDPTVYTPTGVYTDKVENGQLIIDLPNTSYNVHLFINGTELELNQSYSNSWCTMTYTNISDGTEANTTDLIVLDVTMEDNVPQSSSSNIDNVKDYIKYAGLNNDSASGCDIFNSLLNDSAISTKSRDITVTMKYDYQEHNIEHTVKSYYKLTQPGYIEKRRIPKININIENDLNSLERANNVDNGVLCNQFQFFINVNVEDFDREYWSSFVDDDNIKLSFDIKNVPVDYELVEKYAIQSAQDMYTYHAFTKDIDNDFTNNVFRMKTYFIGNDIDNCYETSLSKLYESRTNSHIQIIDDITSTGAEKAVDDTVIMTSSMFNGNSPEYAVRSSGINDSVTISFKDLTFNDIKNNTFRFRVLVEISNPIFSKLFFRYYVSDAKIEYDGSIFYLGKNNLEKTTLTGRYQTREYMYSSNTLNAFICPISLIAIPENEDDKKIDINKVKISGSTHQLDIQLNPYLPEITRYNDVQAIQQLINNQYIDWFNFNLKKKYLLDNIKSFYVQPIHISDFYDKVSPDDLYMRLYSSVEDGYKVLKSEIKSDSYMNVVYNSKWYNPNLRNDKNTFYYNDELLESSKYNQHQSQAPVFLTQSLSYDVRDGELINAMDIWNYEYKSLNNDNQTNFIGHINAIGNGYVYLNDDYDLNLYSNVLSLEMTKSLNEYDFFDAPYTRTIAQLSKSDNNYPDVLKWFRSLVWQVKWQYGKYYNDTTNKTMKVNALDLVDPGTYQYNYTYNESGVEKTTKSNTTQIPYNYAYSLYPRCAYDSDSETSIVFMLRRPSVCRENQYLMLYQNTLNGIKDLLYNSFDENTYNSNQLENNNLNSLL